VDLYSELMNPEHYDGEESDWTYLSQPAILEPADDPKDWVTLWPYSDRPHALRPGEQREDGLWPKWDGPRLAKLRRKIKPATWALVYMQQSVSEETTFPIEALNAVQENRIRGVKLNLFSSYTVAGLDPATASGFTACTVLQVDRDTGKRHLIDVFNQRVRAAGLRQLIMDWTEKYGINEWRIEKNAFQSFLTEDPEINRFLAARGVRLKDHTTGQRTGAQSVGKFDPTWGVASMDSLFRGWEDGNALITFPAMASKSEAYRQLKEQLVAWYPDHPKTQKTDLVMSLWFAELAAREVTRHLGVRKQEFLDNPFLSENDRAARTVIHVDEWLRQQHEDRMQA
jgi:hypothetical protein